MTPFWMLAYKVPRNEYVQSDTVPALKHGWFASKKRAQIKIDSIEDGLEYIPVKLHFGETFETPPNTPNP